MVKKKSESPEPVESTDRARMRVAEARWYALKQASGSLPPFIAGMSMGERRDLAVLCADLARALADLAS